MNDQPYHIMHRATGTCLAHNRQRASPGFLLKPLSGFQVLEKAAGLVGVHNRFNCLYHCGSFVGNVSSCISISLFQAFMGSPDVVEAALFAQLQPHALSKQEACMFSSVKDEYFVARDHLTTAWYRNPTEYLTFDSCLETARFKALDRGLAWRAFAFLTKNGYINAGLVHPDRSLQTVQKSSNHSFDDNPVADVPVRSCSCLAQDAVGGSSGHITATGSGALNPVKHCHFCNSAFGADVVGRGAADSATGTCPGTERQGAPPIAPGFQALHTAPIHAAPMEYH